MENLEGRMKEFVLSKGADLVGIASVSRLGGAPDVINQRISYLMQKLLLFALKGFQIV